MSEITTQLGKVNLLFRDFSHFTTFLFGYYKALTDPIESPEGNKAMPLIGLDGNPTDDTYIFANRQQIISNFVMMRNAYIEEYGRQSLEHFYNTNIDKILSHSAVFNKLYSDFNEQADEYDKLYTYLNGEANKFYQDYVGDKKETPEAQSVLKGIKLRMLQGLRLGEKLKRLFSAAGEYNIELMLFKMMTAFLKDGLDFFGEPEIFEDFNKERLIEMYNRLKAISTRSEKYISVLNG